jgi:hypothetical protein
MWTIIITSAIIKVRATSCFFRRLEGTHDGPMQCRERLGGLLKYYAREAA